VDVGASGLRETLEEIFEQLSLKITDVGRRDFRADDAVRAAAEIHGGGRERFVHRHEEVSGTEDATLGAKRFCDGVAECYTHILDSVMLVHVEVPFGGDVEIESAVARDKIKHVIEEPNAGGDAGFSAAVEIQPETDVRFVGFAMNVGRARHEFSVTCSA
jgi:hypothetical protein